MLVIALTIAVAPPSIANILHNRWKNKIERAIPEFLRDLATASKTGIPLPHCTGTCLQKTLRPPHRRTKGFGIPHELGNDFQRSHGRIRKKNRSTHSQKKANSSKSQKQASMAETYPTFSKEQQYTWKA